MYSLISFIIPSLFFNENGWKDSLGVFIDIANETH